MYVCMYGTFKTLASNVFLALLIASPAHSIH